MSVRFFAAAALVAMAAVSAHADDSSPSVSGKWTSSFGLTELTESGGNVTGSYPFENGKIIGKLSGNRLTGQWTQSTSARKCDAAVNGSYFHGRIEFDFTANEFNGKWGYCDDAPAEQWAGKRDVVSAPDPQARSPLGPAPCPQCPPWVSRSFTGNYLPLAAQAEAWSDPKPFLRKNAQLTVQSRFMGQHGTTCKFEVQFNNVGTRAMDEEIIVAQPGKAAVSQYDSPLRAKLAPGSSVAYGTEVRECPLIWGKSQEMTKCASCEPTVYFVAD